MTRRRSSRGPHSRGCHAVRTDSDTEEERTGPPLQGLLLQVASIVSDAVRPHRRQPTRLPRPWDAPGKNTGVGCHFPTPESGVNLVLQRSEHSHMSLFKQTHIRFSVNCSQACLIDIYFRKYMCVYVCVCVYTCTCMLLSCFGHV